MKNQIYSNNSSNSNYSNNHNKKHKPFVEGENVKYVVTKRISSERAIITIRGQKLLADISIDKPDRGLAKIISVGSKVELKIEHNNKPNNIFIVNKIIDNDTANMLLKEGIKASVQNIDYMSKIIKYFPNLSHHHMRMVLSFMAKDVYPTMDQISLFFSDFLLRTIREQITKYRIKNINETLKNAEKLLELSKNIFADNFAIDRSIYNAIESNGYYAIFCMLFDMFEKEGDLDLLKALKDVLFRLSCNRKSKFLKHDVYAVPIFINVGGKDRFVEIFVSDDNGSERDESFLFGVECYDAKNGALFAIFVKKDIANYKIEVNIFDESMYLKYKKTEFILNGKIDELSHRNKLDVEIEVLSNGKKC